MGVGAGFAGVAARAVGVPVVVVEFGGTRGGGVLVGLRGLELALGGGVVVLVGLGGRLVGC